MELNERLFETILRKSENDETVIVNEVNVKPGCQPGTNFMATVNRVEIFGFKFADGDLYRGGQPFKKTVIVKTQLKDEIVAARFQSSVGFNNEVFAYQKIIPALQKVNRNETLSIPKCLHVADDIIVLEDLAEMNFFPNNIRKGLSYEECFTVLKELAKLHAASLTLQQVDEALFKEVSELVIDIQVNKSDDAFLWRDLGVTFDSALHVLERSSGNDLTKEIELLKQMKGIARKHLTRIFTGKRNHSVINHGDCWISNVLFNGDRVKLIDFQLMRCASVAADLSYFLYVNLHPLLLPEVLDVALKAYLEHLNHFLSVNGTDMRDVLTFDWLKKEMLEFSTYGFVCALLMLPIFTWDEENFTAEAIRDFVETRETNSLDALERTTMKHNDAYRERAVLLAQTFYEINSR